MGNTPSWQRPEKFNPVLDLLDEAGVKAASTGPVCPNCQAEMSPTAIVCVQCGFNKETGAKLETFSDVTEDDKSSRFVETDTDKLLAKAEKEILNAPISTLNQDFGDGSDSIVVALGALLGFGLIIVAGVVTVLVMDRVAQQSNPALISFVVSTVLVVGCVAYISIQAFRAGVIHGVMCLLTVQYCVVFGFMHGRSLIPIAILLQFCLLISGISGYVYFGI
jgi:hypothetical protein